MIHPLVRDLAASDVPVVVTCRVLGFTPQAFYKWKANPVSTRDWNDAHLVDAAKSVHADDPGFGYRFIADALDDEHGITASENRVARLCSVHGIFAELAKGKGRHKKPGPAVHDDLVRRRFRAEEPNALWLTDITEHRTDEGKLYLCATSKTSGQTESSATRSMTG
jgi:transposase InsO family protein